MLKNKKINGVIICVLLITMLVLLVGCGSENNQDESQEVKKNSELSDVKIGDYVSYKAEEGKSYTATSDNTGYDEDQVIKVKGDEKWKVFKIHDDGTVDLISAYGVGTSTREQICFKGEVGYQNAQTEINNMAQIFGTGEFAQSARPMNEEDLKSLINLKDNVATLEEEYKLDLSNCETEEDLWEAINQADDENYKKDFTIAGQTITDTAGIKWKVSGGTMKFDNFKLDETSKNILNYKKENDDGVLGEIWLGGQKTKVNEVGFNSEAYKVEQGISYYYYSGKKEIAIGMLELYTRNFLKSTEKLTKEYDNEENANIRPIVTIRKGVKIDGGTGTEADPYILK